MLSQKNRNMSFVFEEELDQTQNRTLVPGSQTLRSTKENLADSLEGIKLFKEKELVLKVSGEEYKLDRDSNAFFSLAPLLKNIKHSYDVRAKAYILPKNIDKKHLDLFLQFFVISSPNNQVAKISLSTCKRLISISMYFKSLETIKRIIMNYIIPNIDKSTCLTVIKDYINFIYESDYKPLFIDLVQNSIRVAARNIFYLINNFQEELFSIGEDSLEEIIERYFESVIFQSNIDHSLIMRIMMKSRKINDIFELLENERKRSIASFEKMYEDGLQPTIIWKIKCDEPNAGFYKESEEFNFENVSIILINYYDAAKDLYNMALKIVEIKDTEGNTDNDNLSTDHLPHHQQFVISILSICEIKEINLKSKINFNCIFSNTKTKVLVSRIENFSKYFSQNGMTFNNLDYSLVIYFSISYNFSSVLTHICKNFYEYHSLNSISKISKNVINIILKNEYLNVRNEDEVLYAVMNWMNNKTNLNIESCLDVAKNINWTMLSLDGLLDYIISQSKMLLSSPELQSLVIGEFSRRFREEYCVNDAGERDMVMNMSKISSIRKRASNAGSVCSQSQTKSTTGTSFTSELIQKLIKIASKYETPYSNKPSVASGNLTPNPQLGITCNKSSDKIKCTSRNFQVPSDESKMLHVNNTSPVTNANILAKSPGTITPPEKEIAKKGAPNVKIEPKTSYNSRSSSYVTRKQVSSPVKKQNEYPYSQMHNTFGMRKKKLLGNILSQNKDDKGSVSLKIGEISGIKNLLKRNFTPNDNIVKSIRRDKSENNLFNSKSRERKGYSFSNEKKSPSRKSSTNSNFHQNIGHSYAPLGSTSYSSKITFSHNVNEKNPSPASKAANIKPVILKKGSTPVRRTPNHMTNTFELIKNEIQRPRENALSSSGNKIHGKAKGLSYAKQGNAKSNPSLLANVKFIKNDISRAKSASGLRL